MGCGSSKFEDETIKTAIRRLSDVVAVDLEPLLLNERVARRAVLDFVKADQNCSGALTPDEFAHTFGLSADLFLGCVLADMDSSNNGAVDLREFLVGVSQFATASREERDTRVRQFAFEMMDVNDRGVVDKENLKRFTMLAYEQFKSDNTRHKLNRENSWGDQQGRKARAVRDLRSCYQTIDTMCPQAMVTFQQFDRLALEMPLILAPAALVWATFEHLAPSTLSVCNTMVSRGHRSFKVKKGQRKASLSGSEARDRLRTKAEVPTPIDQWRQGQAAPPAAQRLAPSGFEHDAGREPPRGAHSGDEMRRSMDYPAGWNAGRAERDMFTPERRSLDNDVVVRGPPARQAPPPPGPPTPEQSWGVPRRTYDDAEYWGPDTGPKAASRRSPPRYGGGMPQRGGQNGVLNDIMAELQQQQRSRMPGQSNLQAAMTYGARPKNAQYPTTYDI